MLSPVTNLFPILPYHLLFPHKNTRMHKGSKTETYKRNVCLNPYHWATSFSFFNKKQNFYKLNTNLKQIERQGHFFFFLFSHFKSTIIGCHPTLSSCPKRTRRCISKCINDIARNIGTYELTHSACAQKDSASQHDIFHR